MLRLAALIGEHGRLFAWKEDEARDFTRSLGSLFPVSKEGGNEVINPFVVTEVYVRRGGAWTLASLSFTRLLTPP